MTSVHHEWRETLGSQFSFDLFFWYPMVSSPRHHFCWLYCCINENFLLDVTLWLFVSWHCKITILNEYLIYKETIFRSHVKLPEGTLHLNHFNPTSTVNCESQGARMETKGSPQGMSKLPRMFRICLATSFTAADQGQGSWNNGGATDSQQVAKAVVSKLYIYYKD